MRIAMSSGHGLKVRGASGILDEVDEARKVVESVADALRSAGATVATFHDDTSTTQSENLNRIVSWHNGRVRDLDVSVHFNAYQPTDKAMGTECLYLTQQGLAADVAGAVAKAGELINRGPKKRTDLAFLNGTEEPAILIETCFVDSAYDAEVYEEHYADICTAIAETLVGKDITAPPPEERPPEATAPPPLPFAPPTLGNGDRGSSVVTVQAMLDVDADGDFGPATERAVEAYQSAKGLSVDGLVGPSTWAQLAFDFGLAPYPPQPLPPLSEWDINAIKTAVARSPLVDYYWRDRGAAPIGYLNGMAFAFATMLRKLAAGDMVALITAQADRDDAAEDVLSWYAKELADLDMDCSETGVDTLRHLFVIMIGLGMRESSGRHCCGRDTSASNTSAETAESGLFQMSWNAHGCSTDVEKLLDEYEQMGPCQQCARELFADDVSCSSTEWSNYGSGQGATYQKLAKEAPQFAVESAALCLRYLRQHWGPVNRREIELKQEVDDLLLDIQAIIGDVPVAEEAGEDPFA